MLLIQSCCEEISFKASRVLVAAAVCAEFGSENENNLCLIGVFQPETLINSEFAV